MIHILTNMLQVNVHFKHKTNNFKVVRRTEEWKKEKDLPPV